MLFSVSSGCKEVSRVGLIVGRFQNKPPYAKDIKSTSANRRILNARGN